MNQKIKKILISGLSFSLLSMMILLVSNSHIKAQNSGDLDPASLEAFNEVMNEEIIALRVEMNDPGVNSKNNLAIFNYYIAVRDYYLMNPVDLQQAFEVQVSIFKQHNISSRLSDALLDESAPNPPVANGTAVSGNSSSDTAIQIRPSSQLQSRINQLQIVGGSAEGFNHLFEFIRSHK